MKTVQHMFMTGDTVIAAIKKYNGYFMPESQIKFLLDEFRKINGVGPFKPGMTVEVPILN